MPNLRRLVLYFAAATLVAIVAAAGLAWHWDAGRLQTSSGQSLIGGPFTLTDQHGKQVTEQQFAGRFMLIYFGYTFCPDVCPTALTVMSAALDRLPKEQAEQVVPIFITVDPSRDTPEVMAEYVQAFHPKLVGLTGSEAEVAAAAGVSRSTVSRVVNGSTAVSAEALEAVRRAISQLNYVPNRAARSLASRQTHAIALVVPEDTTRFFGDPFFARTVRGVTDRLTRSGTQLLLTMTGGTQDRERAAGFLTGQHVDGVILLSLHADDPLPELLEARGVPTVCGGRPTAQHPRCVVDADNRSGGRLAVEHLLGIGRRRIAVVALARRLSRILYAMWRDECDYEAGPRPTVAAV